MRRGEKGEVGSLLLGEDVFNLFAIALPALGDLVEVEEGRGAWGRLDGKAPVRRGGGDHRRRRRSGGRRRRREGRRGGREVDERDAVVALGVRPELLLALWKSAICLPWDHAVPCLQVEADDNVALGGVPHLLQRGRQVAERLAGHDAVGDAQFHALRGGEPLVSDQRHASELLLLTLCRVWHRRHTCFLLAVSLSVCACVGAHRQHVGRKYQLRRRRKSGSWRVDLLKDLLTVVQALRLLLLLLPPRLRRGVRGRARAQMDGIERVVPLRLRRSGDVSRVGFGGRLHLGQLRGSFRKVGLLPRIDATSVYPFAPLCRLQTHHRSRRRAAAALKGLG